MDIMEQDGNMIRKINILREMMTVTLQAAVRGGEWRQPGQACRCPGGGQGDLLLLLLLCHLGLLLHPDGLSWRTLSGRPRIQVSLLEGGLKICRSQSDVDRGNIGGALS